MNIGIKKEAIRQALLFFAGLLALSLTSSCERRPLEEIYVESALIPVKIDWSYSGISVTDPAGSGNVHRVSLRFFPKDGSAPFERYMELNVVQDEIEVPVGKYSVVVYNESYQDAYWSDQIVFSNPNSYTQFAATITDDDATNYHLYTPLDGETLIVEPLSLASWSLDDFEVTQDMVRYTRYSTTKSTTTSTQELEAMTQALTKVVMRRLSYNVIVNVWAENLVSAQTIEAAVRGFAKKVYLASAQTEYVPATHVFGLNNRIWDAGSQTCGCTTHNFLSFGRLPHTESYRLNMDLVYVNGDKCNLPLLFDVTDQVVNQTNTHVSINIDASINLPLIQGGSGGGINVGEWEDEEVIIK